MGLFYLAKVGKMERINGKEVNDLETAKSVIDDIITTYCIDNDLDEKDINPCIWDDIIQEIYIQVFKNNRKLLKTESVLNNEYDKRKVFECYENIYKRICNKHIQEVFLKGFLDMTGIDKQTIYNWKDNIYINNSINNGIDNNTGEKLSTKGFDLHEKIMADNEQSLFNLMKDRRTNPMKILPKLNKVHGWNGPGMRAETVGRIESRTAAEIAQEYNNQNTPKLPES